MKRLTKTHHITPGTPFLLHVDHNVFPRDLHLSNKYAKDSFSSVANLFIADRKYFDPEFLPALSSITQRKEETSFNDFEYGSNVTRWLRPEQIRWSKESQQYPLSIFNDPHSKDIIQGRLGDCWLISALALIADIPEILYKIMITKQYNPAGLYKIRLCNRGIWRTVTIDDLLPVSEFDTLAFTRSLKKQLFASLIEKALAKMYGSYKALESGRCVEGLQILTGEPCEVFSLHSVESKKKANLDILWTNIVQSQAKGLEPDHAYSILDVRQVASRRFVRLRNPWGMKERRFRSTDNDGVFWMPWEAMSLLFSEITICKINASGYKIRKRGQFSDFSSKVTSAYNLHCSYETELNIELFNPVNTITDNQSNDPAIDLFLIVLCSDGTCKQYKHSLDYYVTLSITVPSGQYVILAGSMSVVNYSIYSKFNLVVHADQPFVLKEQPASYELVANAFHAVALQSNNRKVFGDGVSILTFDDNGCFGFICENRSNRAIRFASDFHGSINVLPSRKTLRTNDIIPARTRQLFAIYTRKVMSDDVNIVYQVEYSSLNTATPGVDHTCARNTPPISVQAFGLHVPKPIY
ncbi:unnamed protein product [Adineta ricciae]|uniref:Calpain catalytic domain-containing protein n=1 Tax=Adineta ricciae TaxID=249248 RepID=A0A815KS66_ADIRI|nr:unnamed protein product [Adineta ricciae]CAF1400231.1 unnamed protein product [Adineta ricciae]